ncbi:unnamed protein product [Ilex paraguariensis]|uniref:PX domain-containing protein n=1 Tax=Ilex paraguariensis TaxID=185542 RepID=A0ABC8T650_9AQUA
MNPYEYDFSLIDYGFSDPTILDSISLYRPSRMITSDSRTETIGADHKPPRPPIPEKIRSPPRHRHDGTSPLPLGMDWSHPPRKWDGRGSVWPHDFHTGWSYCVTIPSWVITPKSRDSVPVVFYRVQIGIQSPEGVTSTRGILRRFNDFLKLSSDCILKKNMRKLVIMCPENSFRLSLNCLVSSQRRCFLEDWMEKLLSDIDLSRSAPVATFLELEAAARSSFYDMDSNQSVSDINLPGSSVVLSYEVLPSSDVSLVAGTSSFAADYGNDSAYETSELGTPRHGRDTYSEIGNENTTSDQELVSPIDVKDSLSESAIGRLMEGFIRRNQDSIFQHKIHSRSVDSGINRYKVDKTTSKAELRHEDETKTFSETEIPKLGSHFRRLSMESLGSDISSVRASEISNLGVADSLGDDSFERPEGYDYSKAMDIPATSGLQFSSDLVIALPSDEHRKINRLLITMQRRLATGKTDMEDLIARLNQELAVRQYLTTKDICTQLRFTVILLDGKCSSDTLA